MASLYLARSEGRIIQSLDSAGQWWDKDPEVTIHYGNRVKPQTVEEAAKIYSETPKQPKRTMQPIDLAAYDFTKGAEWRDENPKEQDDD